MDETPSYRFAIRMRTKLNICTVASRLLSYCFYVFKVPGEKKLMGDIQIIKGTLATNG